jgi:hypothetical protein
MSDEVRKKMNALSRRQLQHVEAGKGIEVLIRLGAPITNSERRQLAEAGCEAFSEAGTIVSARIADASRVQEVARLPFVRRIDISRDLYQEQTESANPEEPNEEG